MRRKIGKRETNVEQKTRPFQQVVVAFASMVFRSAQPLRPERPSNPSHPNNEPRVASQSMLSRWDLLNHRPFPAKRHHHSIWQTRLQKTNPSFVCVCSSSPFPQRPNPFFSSLLSSCYIIRFHHHQRGDDGMLGLDFFAPVVRSRSISSQYLSDPNFAS